jgi:hypothetical protein
MLHGIMCPEYWMQGGDVLALNKTIARNDPSVFLKIRTIFCNDVFNNWLLMLTFGLCSPVLAVAIACSVLLKMSLWVLLIGRFTRCILEDENGITLTDSTAVAVSPSQQSISSKMSTISGTTNAKRDEVGNFFLAALAEVYIPLFEVLAGSFWRLVWCSMLFVALLSWDIAADEVGWLKSLWVPLVPLGYVLILRCVAYFCNYSSDSGGDSKQELAAEMALALGGSGVSQSPLHEEKVDML